MSQQIELRAGGMLHGVLRGDLSLEVKRGDRLFRYDLMATLRTGRPVVVIRLLHDENERGTKEATVKND